MNADSTADWHEANQRDLMRRVAAVRGCLQLHATQIEKARAEANEASESSNSGERESRHQADGTDRTNDVPLATNTNIPAVVNDAPDARSALSDLCAAFALSDFERDVLTMCAGMELDGSFAATCARAHGDAARAYPTFGLALAALPNPHWSALTPAAPLRRWRLIEFASGGESLTQSAIRIDERVLHHLTGTTYLDERLRSIVLPVVESHALPASHQALAQRIAAFWRDNHTHGALPLPAVLLCGGGDGAGKRAVALAACDALRWRLHSMSSRDVPAQTAERHALATLWEREAALLGSVLLLDADENENTHELHSFIEDLRGALIVTSRDDLTLRERNVLRLDVSKPAATEQHALWQNALASITHKPNLAHELNGHLKTITAQFNLPVKSIYAASLQAGAVFAQNETVSPPRQSPSASHASLSSPAQVLWDACRIQARPRLDQLAARIEPVAGWSDLVLPESQLRSLSEILMHVRQRATVYETFGFARKGSRGLGIAALFAGASGTGKTMAAEVLANELRLDLYRIDLSQIVSKYIGETEKNLRRVFDAAEASGAVLLFDEADALFGKRTEVKDSHDRYANIEVSYLLQRMEEYRGLAILTTNMKKSLDSAFLRRLRFVVQFPFPDHAQRAEIWRRIFPAQTPTEKLEPDKLARLNVAGGNIRNIALHAAFLAADANESVTMAHLLRAARGEYGKLEKPLTDAESGGWL